jgi:hypothetical protein
MKTRKGAVLGLLSALLTVGDQRSARAYDPATTHAGLTERAVLASTLHRVLSRRLGRPLGLLEPLQIHSRYFEPGARRALWARFEALDPAGGYRPGADGVAGALSWVVAGSVLAQTPPERGRNHFLDPSRRAGLDDAPGLTGVAHQLRMTFDQGTSVRDLATGNAFDMTGQSSLEWIVSPQNDLGLPALLDHLDHAVSAGEPAERESSLVRALLALGGLMSVLEDAGEPAHVRNDFRAAFLRQVGPSSWDRGSAFERFVAGRYGRLGIPAPRAVRRRPTLESYFTAADGEGLADRTQRRFFSEGTVPEDVALDPGTNTRDVVEAARDSLAYPSPGLPSGTLELKQLGTPHYVVVEGRRQLGYVRVPGRVRFFLDDGVYADSARALLPEVAAYAAGLLDHLVRAGLTLTASGRQVTITLEGTSSPRNATLRLYAEDDAGRRRELPAVAAVDLQAGHPLEIAAPAGVHRIAAVVRGQDAGGEFVAVGETAIE